MSDDADFDSASAASVLGNTTNKTKIAVSRWLHIVCRRRTGFGDDIGNKVRLTEISVKQTPNEPEKMEGKVVAEITVTQDMTNLNGVIHGGCIMYLADILSPLSVCALDCEQGRPVVLGVTQSLQTLFHAPAGLGAHLKIINTSLSVGGRTTTSRCEIWDTTNHRLVASAVQVRMESRL